MDKNRRVILFSLAGSLIAVIFFAFGLTISKGNLIVDVVYYFSSLALLLASFLALYNNNKQEKHSVFVYLMFVNVMLMALMTFYVINNHL